MKVTIVLIADDEVENYGRKILLEANRIGKVGFEMTRLPFHVSLKQPFVVPSLEEMEGFFDKFAQEISPIELNFEELVVYPNNAIGGEPSGCLSIKIKKTLELDGIQKKLFSDLERKFGPCPAPFDDDYIFHMTVAIGKASYENYERAYDVLCKSNYSRSVKFQKMGLLYYDDDNILPGTYFCYKTVDLKQSK